MTKNNPAMRRVAPNSSVRRRLFSDDDTEQARIDNSSNALLEIMSRDKEEKKQQWSFDFENDRPIEGGTYTWSFAEGPYDWVGKMAEKKTTASKSVDEDEDAIRMRKENEETPKSKEDGVSVAPEIRKRKKEGDVVVKEARRKISFD